MKSLLRVIALSFVVLSMGACQSDKEEVAPLEFTGTWRLETVIGGATGEAFPAKNLGYDQYYTLSDDNTFRKFRSTGAVTSGTYTIEIIDEKPVAVLEIKERSEIGEDLPIGVSCSTGRFYLYLKENALHDNNLACDIGYDIYKKAAPVK